MQKQRILSPYRVIIATSVIYLLIPRTLYSPTPIVAQSSGVEDAGAGGDHLTWTAYMQSLLLGNIALSEVLVFRALNVDVPPERYLQIGRALDRTSYPPTRQWTTPEQRSRHIREALMTYATQLAAHAQQCAQGPQTQATARRAEDLQEELHDLSALRPALPPDQRETLSLAHQALNQFLKQEITTAAELWATPESDVTTENIHVVSPNSQARLQPSGHPQEERRKRQTDNTYQPGLNSDNKTWIGFEADGVRYSVTIIQNRRGSQIEHLIIASIGTPPQSRPMTSGELEQFIKRARAMARKSRATQLGRWQALLTEINKNRNKYNPP